MKKNTIKIMIIVVLVIVLGAIIGIYIMDNNSQNTELSNNILNREAPPDKPDGNGGAPGQSNNSNVSHTGATEISTDTTNNYCTLNNDLTTIKQST